MCGYCENYEKHISEMKLDDVFIMSNAKYTLVGDGQTYSIPLNYCSNCGRKLREPILGKNVEVD